MPIEGVDTFWNYNRTRVLKFLNAHHRYQWHGALPANRAVLSLSFPRWLSWMQLKLNLIFGIFGIFGFWQRSTGIPTFDRLYSLDCISIVAKFSRTADFCLPQQSGILWSPPKARISTCWTLKRASTSTPKSIFITVKDPKKMKVNNKKPEAV